MRVSTKFREDAENYPHLDLMLKECELARKKPVALGELRQSLSSSVDKNNLRHILQVVSLDMYRENQGRLVYVEQNNVQSVLRQVTDLGWAILGSYADKKGYNNPTSRTCGLDWGARNSSSELFRRILMLDGRFSGKKYPERPNQEEVVDWLKADLAGGLGLSKWGIVAANPGHANQEPGWQQKNWGILQLAVLGCVNGLGDTAPAHSILVGVGLGPFDKNDSGSNALETVDNNIKRFVVFS